MNIGGINSFEFNTRFTYACFNCGKEQNYFIDDGRIDSPANLNIVKIYCYYCDFAMEFEIKISLTVDSKTLE